MDRIDAGTRMWVATEPCEVSVLGDVLFQTDLAGLELHFLGGLKVKRDRPVIHFTEAAARTDAEARLAARDAKAGASARAGLERRGYRVKQYESGRWVLLHSSGGCTESWNCFDSAESAWDAAAELDAVETRLAR
jgi:hypothetical protein